MTGSKYANFDYDLSLKILNLLKGAYPARLKRVLIVTAPLWFKAPFKILRLFVKEKLRDRVYTISVSELYSYVPKETLPVQLGGAQEPGHKVWLQFCYQCATNQQSDPNTYFISCSGAGRRFMSRSKSRDTDDHISSKDTVTEKHTNEDREKKKDQDSVLKKENTLRPIKDKRLAYRKHKTSEFRKSRSDLLADNELVVDMPRKKRQALRQSELDSIHLPDDTDNTMQELLSKVNKLKRTGLVSEYEQIKKEQLTDSFVNSNVKANRHKNRYRDILCYDHSRVILPIVGRNPSSDYINANYMDGYKQKNAFISTQGPLTKTFGDFWRMVWLTQSRIIAMTTRTMEQSKIKCGQYWPLDEQADQQFTDFIVHNNGIRKSQDFIETQLMLHNTITGESRLIIHLHFISWPDYGVPPAAGFLEFLFRVRYVQEAATREMGSAWTGHPLGPPIIVHCSAGVGRTGTFLAVDICLRQLEDVGTINIKETVRRLRTQRAYSIQTPEQYVFCHQVIIEQARRHGLIDSKEIIPLEDDDTDSVYE